MIEAGIVLGVLALGFFMVYNSLIGKKNEVNNAFGGMDVQLKKRYDLIPNLVNAVKTYMQHERGVLEEITKLRAKAIETPSGNSDELVGLDNLITKALGQIKIAVENYPDLKSSSNFIDLQRSLNEVEAQISASRRSYNAAVTAFNNGIEMFPGNLLAGFMKLSRKEVFEISEGERENVNVGELFNA